MTEGGEATERAIERLYALLLERRHADPAGSYTARLFAKGSTRIAQKLAEEAVETALAAALGDREGVIGESADLLYHLLVLWADQGVRPEDVIERLRSREGVSGLAEKAGRTK